MSPSRIFLAALLLAAASRAEVLYVGKPQHWLTVQDTFAPGLHFETAAQALARAGDGDRVVILKDLSEPLLVEKRLELLGWGHERRPLLSGGLTIRADGVVVDGLHFRGVRGAAVLVEGARGVTIRRCFVTESDHGIELRAARECVVDDNRLLFAGNSIFLNGGGGHLVRRNQIDSGSWYALRVEGSSQNRLIENHVRRAGWVGILLFAGSTDNELVGNVLEGGDIGVSIQTDRNVVRENTFFGGSHGLVLARSPLGKDPAGGRIAYLDAEAGDEHVVAADNRIEGNLFRGCRQDAVLLREARHNVVRENRVVGGAGRGFVLLGGADDNLLEANDVGAHPGPPLVIVGSAGNRLVDNVLREGGRVRLVDAPDNVVEGADAQIERLEAGEVRRNLRPSPDESGLLLAWGDFHSHSLLSDGSASADELLSYARDVAELDFVALSDHGEEVGQGDGRWEALRAAALRYTVPGRFLAVPGFETTFPMGWEAHFNVYYAGAEGRPYMAPWGGKGWIPNLETLDAPHLLENLLRDGADTLVIRHHYWSTPYYWRETPPDSPLLPMTEICSVHAIWSGDRDVDEYASERGGEMRGHAATMQGAFAAGRILGVGGGSDSHYGFPGDAALVGVLTESLDAADLFEAVRRRRTYATTGARIRLGFSVNGQPMGSVLDDVETPRLEVRVEGTADLEEVVILESGAVALRLPLDGRTCRGDWSPPGPPPDGTYYQVRVRQADGELAWSTPVWIRPGEPDLAGQQVIADRERMAILAYAAVLRAWPDLPNGELGGRTPRQAATDPALASRVDRLLAAALSAAEEIEKRGAALALQENEQAQEILRVYGWRFGALPPPLRFEPTVAPLVDPEALRAALGR